MIHTGDCVEVMAQMEPESVDAIVTDPPYGLEFMGREWDRLDGTMSQPGFGSRPIDWPAHGDDFAGYNPTCATCGGRARGARKCSCAEPDWRVKGARPAGDRQERMQAWHHRWAEAAYRVAKPSAYLLAFGGTRTFHRLACALEDAGWIIRDTLVWGYASGFPKSKASLKPAWEPIVMARKPGPLRDLAIDACRIGTTRDVPASHSKTAPTIGATGFADRRLETELDPNRGRWPANIVLTDPIFDGGWEGVVGGGYQESTAAVGAWAPRGAFPIDNPNPVVYGDSGTYSRFFLIPKADRADREPVLGGLPLKERADQSSWYQQCGECGERFVDPTTGQPRCGHDARKWVTGKPRANVHPTVKPTDLMRHLVRLVTPAGGVVLDPFLGSGTTAIAAEMEGFAWVGIERELEYVAIAEARLNGVQKGLGLSA